MLHLLQLLKMLTKKQRTQFLDLFSDLDDEINDLGYKGSESELISTMLFNHFGIELLDDRQLERITACIIDKRKFELTKNAINSGVF